MDRKNKRRKNKGEIKTSTKDGRKAVGDECISRSKKSEILKDDNREASSSLLETNSKNCKSTENLKQLTSTTAEDETRTENYRKRQINSNWDRYEESHAEIESLETKGTDFNVLLQSSGGSFFRFRDEQEWEEIHETKAETSEFLSLNSEDLAKAISCIPLPNRLMIKEENFPPKLLNKLKKSAKEKMQQYKIVNSYSDDNKDLTYISLPSDEPVEEEIYLVDEEDNETDDKNEIVDKEISKNALSDWEGSDSEEVDVPKDINLPNEISSDKDSVMPSKTIPSKSCDPENDEENELNYLLSLNVPVKPQVTCLDKKQQENSEKPIKNIEEKNLALFPESKPVASLEDWLDEMLDDEE